MNILTLDPLGPTPSAPCAAPGFRDLRGSRMKIPCRALAWTGVIASLALLGTTLPANAAPRGGMRSGGIPRTPPMRVVPRNPGRAGLGNFNNGGNLNNGVSSRAIYPNGNNGVRNNLSIHFYNGGPNVGNGNGADGNGTDGNGGPGDPTGSGIPETGGAPSENVSPRSGAIPGSSKPSAPLTTPVTGTGNGQSHLEAALQDLSAAEQAMKSSATPDVAGIKSYLTTASKEISVARVNFIGQRRQAIADIQSATRQLNQGPPSSQAIGLTGDAINNVMDCLR